MGEESQSVYERRSTHTMIVLRKLLEHSERIRIVIQRGSYLSKINFLSGLLHL